MLTFDLAGSPKIRNTTPRLGKQLRGLERTVHVSRPLVPRFNPATGQMEVAPAPKGSGSTLNLGKCRAARRAERRLESRSANAAGNRRTNQVI